MLSEKFVSRLREEFPRFYERVNDEAMHWADELRREAGGDVKQALVKARLQGAARLWWPYVKGTLPLMGDDREAMEGFSRIVLTVDHLVGYKPPSMEAARDQVANVLRDSLDYERLKRLVERDQEAQQVAAAGAAGVAGTGLLASVGALMSPITVYRQLRRYGKYVPAPVRVALGAVIVAAVASVPLVAGYSAGLKAEEAARNYGESPTSQGAGPEKAAQTRSP